MVVSNPSNSSNFSLESNGGKLMINEKVGVLGENGIGKTSFVKLLAGIDAPDNTKLDLKVKVSYKPQYLESESDELVMNILQNAIKNYETELIRPLDLKPLFHPFP